MEFKVFKTAVKKQFDSMLESGDRLFITSADKNELWDYYLDSFPAGTNEIFKERREYDCNSCKQFIRHYSRIVTIKNNELVSVWDIEGLPEPFATVAKAMAQAVKSYLIRDIFVTKLAGLGVDKNRQLLKEDNDRVIIWEHFYYKLPKAYVDSSGDTIDRVMAQARDSKNVFARSMEELTLEAGKVILELMEQKSLYKGDEFKPAIKTFVKYKKGYDKVSTAHKDNWLWLSSFNNPIARIRNTAIGTLLVDISAGVDLDEAVRKFERVVAPSNYKRPKPIFTKRMIEEAEKIIEELGFTDSLHRRFAYLDDITINNVLFVNRDVRKKLKGSVFDDLKEEVVTSPKKFDKVDEISIEDFVRDVLPSTTNLELMVENKHKGNFMSLIAPDSPDAPPMFKWKNMFGWAYNNDVADSIKQNVKKAGGNVGGVLRFSIQWNDGLNHNGNDFDAHCKEPSGNLISFNKMRNPSTSGVLDVDIISPIIGKPAVENITWSDKGRMQEGIYIFLVHNYTHNGGRDGFTAEIEYEGEVFTFNYPAELRNHEKVTVAQVQFTRADGIRIVKSLDSTIASKQVWGVNTHKFVRVSTFMFSPNYWDDQKGIGNKHYFFMLENCKNNGTPRGFFNEFLNEKLTPHRKVLEALGSRMRVEESDNQLSGLGFSTTQRNTVLAKVEGSMKRVVKIIF